MIIKRQQCISIRETKAYAETQPDIRIDWKGYVAVPLTLAMLIGIPLGVGMRHGLLWGAVAGLGIWSLICAIIFISASIRGRQMEEELYS